MKTYELIVTDFDGVEEATIVATVEGQKRYIPTDPANSDYAEYLRYTAWVEAGNDPDEFWTQDKGL